MRIIKDDTIAVLVDIQEKLFPHINEYEKILENSAKLLKGLEILEVPVMVTEQYTKGLGYTVEPLKNLLKDYSPIEKSCFSCADSHEFIDKIKNSEKRNVILFGIETHVCVLQTAVDLLDHGFNPVIVVDCVGSRKANDKKYALKRMQSEGCILTTYESVLFEMCRVSGTETFKQISKLVK